VSKEKLDKFKKDMDEHCGKVTAAYKGLAECMDSLDGIKDASKLDADEAGAFMLVRMTRMNSEIVEYLS